MVHVKDNNFNKTKVLFTVNIREGEVTVTISGLVNINTT